MTTGFNLGLIGRDIAGVSSVQNRFAQDGEQLDLDVAWHLESLVDAKAVRDQVLGYAEPGVEPVLPLVWDEDETRSGYYRLVGAGVDTDRQLLNSHKAQARLQLERIHGYNAPAIESVHHGSKRSFASAYSGADYPWTAIPSTWRALELYGSASSLTPAGIRLGADGVPLDVYQWGALYDASVLQHADPEHFYDGAVTLRCGPDQAVITGYQPRSDMSEWCIDNGLIQVRNPGRGSSQFDIVTRGSSGWVTRERGLVVRYSYSVGTGLNWGGSIVGDPTGTISTPERINIVRNTPEAVTICLTFGLDRFIGVVRVFLTLRRGSRFVAVSIASQLETTWGLGYDTGFTGSGTNFTNYLGSSNVGVKESANDSNGQRSFILRGTANTTLDGSEAYLSIAGRLAEFGVGALPGTPDPTDSDEMIASQWLAAQTETMQVVAQ